MCQLESDATIDPFTNIVVNIGTECIAVITTALLPLATVVGIAHTESSLRTLITTAKGDRMASAPRSRLLKQILIIGPRTCLIGSIGFRATSEDGGKIIGRTCPRTSVLGSQHTGIIIVLT